MATENVKIHTGHGIDKLSAELIKSASKAARADMHKRPNYV
jgi:hypothetical protein